MTGDRRVTLRDVARAANVSVSAASMALNNRPGVSRKTRSLVLATAERLRYVPDQRARELRLGQQAEVALAVNPALTQDVGMVSRLFALRLLATLNDELRQRELRPLPLQPETDYSRSVAAVVIGDGPWFEQWRPVLPDVPILAAGASMSDPRVAATLVHDHHGYVAQVIHHLDGHGAQHIALLREPSGGNYQHIVTGLTAQATRERGLRLSVIPARIREPESREAARRAVLSGADAVFSLLPFPGAILAGIADAGARVPHDVLLVVRGEGLIESQTTPKVTSLSMCGQESALQIATVLDAVRDGARGLHATLPHRLLERASSMREP